MVFAESECVELKSQMVGDICREVIAFANTKGGVIYIGVQDDGQVLGVKDVDHVTLQISNMVRDSIKPDVTMFVRYETLEVEGKHIIAVTVQQGSARPYYLGNKGLKPSGVYVRSGTSTNPASDAAIRTMIKATDGDCFETMRSMEQSLTFETAANQFEKCEISFDEGKMETLGLVSHDGVYTNAAMLLSDQCSSTIKAAAFAGTDKNEFQDRREFGGSLFRQMEEAYSYLDLRNQTRASFEGLYRRDVRDYPEEALREALLNSLVHRDYSFSASTLISVYEDRVEFVSVGGLLDGISLDDIMLGLSICRNPKLAAIFYRLKLIEAYGTGLPKIIKAYEGSGLRPTIEVTSNAFKITLPNRNADAKESSEHNEAEVTDRNEEIILSYIESNGRIARSDVDLLLDVSQATSNRILKRMVAEGLLYKDGNGKRTKYKRI